MFAFGVARGVAADLFVVSKSKAGRLWEQFEVVERRHEVDRVAERPHRDAAPQRLDQRRVRPRQVGQVADLQIHLHRHVAEQAALQRFDIGGVRGAGKAAAQLPEGDVTVQVDYSTINYKDGLAITGKAPVVRKFPMVPGIDIAGVVLESSHADWKAGDQVVVTGWGMGENAWGGLTQRPAIGAHDNLFQLGADSIMSIQAVARAHSANLHLPPSLIFQNPTIAQLARIATWRRAAQAEQGAVTGAVALTPIQELFFAADSPEPHHFNMSAMHVVGGDLDAPRLRTALRHLLVHHDALRLRFVKSADGWSQSCAPPPLPAEAGDDDPAFAIVDLGHLMGSAQAAALTERASALQPRLELTRGPLLRMIYFTLGAGRPGRLLIVVHHLIIDGISWRILLEDLETAYGQLAQAIDLLLPLAEKGDVFAMDLLAQQYEYASDDVRDLKQALHWHLLAASALW